MVKFGGYLFAERLQHKTWLRVDFSISSSLINIIQENKNYYHRLRKVILLSFCKFMFCFYVRRLQLASIAQPSTNPVDNDTDNSQKMLYFQDIFNHRTEKFLSVNLFFFFVKNGVFMFYEN